MVKTQIQKIEQRYEKFLERDKKEKEIRFVKETATCFDHSTELMKSIRNMSVLMKIMEPNDEKKKHVKQLLECMSKELKNIEKEIQSNMESLEM